MKVLGLCVYEVSLYCELILGLCYCIPLDHQLLFKGLQLCDMICEFVCAVAVLE